MLTIGIDMNFVVVACYALSSWSRAQFEEYLEDIREFVRRRLLFLIIVAGDFNVKSALWGFLVTSSLDGDMEEWAADNHGQN